MLIESAGRGARRDRTRTHLRASARINDSFTTHSPTCVLVRAPLARRQTHLRSTTPKRRMTKIDYENGVHKDMGKAQAHVVNLGDKTSMKIVLQPGFDWVSEVGPKLPGCPKWCPANHFGYLESGTMKVKYEDGSTSPSTGESYLIPPVRPAPFVSDAESLATVPSRVSSVASLLTTGTDLSPPRYPGHLPEVIGDIPASWSSSPSPPRRLQHEGLMTPRGTSERHPRTRAKRQKRKRSTAHPHADDTRRRRRCSFSDDVEVLTRNA